MQASPLDEFEPNSGEIEYPGPWAHPERVEDAISWIERSEAIAAADDSYVQITCRSLRARFLADEGMLPAADAFAKESVDRAMATDWLEVQAKARLDHARVLRLAGRVDEAMASTTEAMRLYERKGHVVGARRTRRVLEEIRSGAGAN